MDKTTRFQQLPETFLRLLPVYHNQPNTSISVTVKLALTLDIFSHCQLQQLQSSISLCRSSGPHTLQVLGWPDIPRSTHHRSLRLQSSNKGSAYRHNGRLQGPVSERDTNKLTKNRTWRCRSKQSTTQQLRNFTEIRLRKMIRSSGTPFLISSSIAWLAELPAQTRYATSSS